MEVYIWDNINIENYFDDEEVAYIFKCTKCNYEDPVPDWLLDEFGAFSRKPYVF